MVLMPSLLTNKMNLNELEPGFDRGWPGIASNRSSNHRKSRVSEVIPTKQQNRGDFTFNSISIRIRQFVLLLFLLWFWRNFMIILKLMVRITTVRNSFEKLSGNVKILRNIEIIFLFRFSTIQFAPDERQVGKTFAAVTVEDPWSQNLMEDTPW